MAVLLADEQGGGLGVVGVLGAEGVAVDQAKEAAAVGTLAELEDLDRSHDRPPLGPRKLRAPLPGDLQQGAGVGPEVGEPAEGGPAGLGRGDGRVKVAHAKLRPGG